MRMPVLSLSLLAVCLVLALPAPAEDFLPAPAEPPVTAPAAEGAGAAAGVEAAAALPDILQQPEWMRIGPTTSIEDCGFGPPNCPPGCSCVKIRNQIRCFCP